MKSAVVHFYLSPFQKFVCLDGLGKHEVIQVSQGAFVNMQNELSLVESKEYHCPCSTTFFGAIVTECVIDEGWLLDDGFCCVV